MRVFAVIDDVPPYLINAWTLDSDADGWIDHIVLQFNENINDLAITGVIDEDSDGFPDVPLVPVSLWNIDGYTGERFNFFDDSPAADNTTVDDALTGTGQQYESEYVYPGNRVNDNILIIQVNEQIPDPEDASAFGDTDAAPKLLFDYANITLEDLSGNKFEFNPSSNPKVTDFFYDVLYAFDKTAPLLLNATTMDTNSNGIMAPRQSL